MDRFDIIIDNAMRAWSNNNDYNEEDKLNALEEFAEYIVSNGKSVGKQTLNFIKQERIKLKQCPNCKSDLITKSEPINYGEAWGKEYEELGSYLYCPQCHWREED